MYSFQLIYQIIVEMFVMQDHEESNNGFRERKAQRHSIWGKSPFE